MNALIKASAVLFQFSLLFVVYFMREQSPISHPRNEDILYSPAHGRIMKIFNYKDHVCISIFLSPLDIHHQYIPINGTVRKVTYDYTGKFELAYNETKSRDNEKCITELQTKHGLVKIFQIAGTVARRIENNLKLNSHVKTGHNMGIIKLGSRVDVLIPAKSRFRIEVKEGDVVSGTHSRLGQFI